jgi:hypothetical protein
MSFVSKAQYKGSVVRKTLRPSQLQLLTVL